MKHAPLSSIVQGCGKLREGIYYASPVWERNVNMLHSGLCICNSHQGAADRTDQFFRRSCSMDDTTVLHACRLLHEALCDDLELKRFVVHVERDDVSITIHPTSGGSGGRPAL